MLLYSMQCIYNYCMYYAATLATNRIHIQYIEHNASSVQHMYVLLYEDFASQQNENENKKTQQNSQQTVVHMYYGNHIDIYIYV